MIKNYSKTRFSIRSIIPSLLTMLAICAGVSALRMGLEGRFGVAVICIIIAAFIDGIDGKIARALNSSSKFGAELDSLADVINFGVVPALLLYMWDLKNLGSWGWFAVLVYIMATALRLARFNVMNALQAEMPQPPKAYFLGVPAPMGALLAILPLFLDLSQFLEGRDLTVFSAIYLIFIAFLMISKLKTISLKAIRFNNKFALPAIFCFAILVALLITKTWEAIVFIDVAYLCYIAFAFYRSIMRSRRRV